MSRHCALTLAAIAALTASLAACAGEQTGTQALAQASDPALSGTHWRLETIDADAAGDHGATLRFEDDAVSLVSACENLEGPWRVEHGRLIAGPFGESSDAADDIACNGQDGAQARALGVLIVAAPAYAVRDDRLELASGGHAARFIRTGG